MSTSQEAPTATPSGRGRPAWMTVAHWVLATGAFVWLLCDPFAVQAFALATSADVVREPTETYRFATLVLGWARTWIMIALVVSVTALVVLECKRLISRRGSRPTVRRLLFVTMMVGLWCGIIIRYESIAWQGKRLRSMGRVNALDELAFTLRNNWPKEDGEIEGLGPFTAYPFGDPSVLLLLTPYPLDGTDTVIAAVERSPQGVLRFQLGGIDGGDWIEWHGGSSRPANFVGGLSERYSVTQYTPLRESWYLVRYDESTSF
ncbi:MAG: hypothetical protein AAGG48_13315 [Planctomycetota bacterium]